MAKKTLAEQAADKVTQAIEFKKQGKYDQEGTYLAAALGLARRARAKYLVEFIIKCQADVGNPYKHKRGALDPRAKNLAGARGMAPSGGKPMGMVGCGTMEMMTRSRIKDMLRRFEGIQAIEFVGNTKVIVRVFTEDCGKALPGNLWGRVITYTVVGKIRKQPTK